MNIFYLDPDPAICARYHGDRHVCKMILESAQLLSTAHRILDNDILDENRSQILYRATHKNHPCAIWVRESFENYRYVHDLLYWLIYEFRYRYGHPHATERLQPLLIDAPHNIPIVSATPVRLCMPDDCKTWNPVLSYRNYYTKYKASIVKWQKKREAPEWWNEAVQNP